MYNKLTIVEIMHALLNIYVKKCTLRCSSEIYLTYGTELTEEPGEERDRLNHDGDVHTK